MEDLSLVLYNSPDFFDYESYRTWNNSSYYGEPIPSAQEESYDDTYYLTYEEVGDYSSRSWFTNKETNQDYNSGTWFGELSSYLSSYCGDEENNSEKQDGSLYDGGAQNEPENEYRAESDGLGFHDFRDTNTSWGDLEETVLYERIFGNWPGSE
ncbi:hypothetical protein ABFS83_10G037900 [Erythranthe nasuta]